MMEKIPVTYIGISPTTNDGKFRVQLTEGKFQNLRRLTSWPLITLFFSLVWIQIDGQPWFLVTFEQQRIVLFGRAFSWHDLPLLTGLLITGACLLFFVTASLGRIWCGFICPQSMWIWLFLRIEYITEGKLNIRRKHDLETFSGKQLIRRIAKHLIWMLLAVITATTFTGYFIPIREIIFDATTINLATSTLCWLIVATGVTYVNSGLLRGKFCSHLCPYSSLQGTMFDRDTLTVSYDFRRGEPRTRPGISVENSGDCVDCRHCIQVCPCGIDIRQGLQATCIDCAACIDACDNMMEQLARPKGLIRFASQAQILGFKSPLLRPHLIGFGVVLAIAYTALLYGLTTTENLKAEVQRDRNTLFTEVNQHTVCNNYLVKVEGSPIEYDQIKISISEHRQFKLFGTSYISLVDNSSTWIPYRVCTKKTTLNQSITPLVFNFTTSGTFVSEKTTFLSSSI